MDEQEKQRRIDLRARRIWEERGRPRGGAAEWRDQARREVEAEDEAEPGPRAGRSEPSSPELPSTASVQGDPATAAATQADAQGDLAQHRKK